MVGIDRLEKRATKLKGLLGQSEGKEPAALRKLRKTLKRVQRKRRRMMAESARLAPGKGETPGDRKTDAEAASS